MAPPVAVSTMNTLWLKRIDGLSQVLPSGLLRPRGQTNQTRPLIVRPGGLGDAVVLTRACIAIGFSPLNAVWLCERRNSIWLRYLGIPHICYDDGFAGLSFLLSGKRFGVTVNTEQIHGLAALFCARVTSRSGTLIGFSAAPRADLNDLSVPYTPESRHELEAFSDILSQMAAILPEDKGTPFAIPPQSLPPRDLAIVGLGGLQASDKRLPVESWVRLIARAGTYAESVALVGAPMDKVYAAEIAAQVPSVQNLVGTIPFNDVVALIRSSRHFLGLDSGLLHVADFFGIQSDVVFPRSNSVQWGPRTEGSKVLTPALV